MEKRSDNITSFLHKSFAVEGLGHRFFSACPKCDALAGGLKKPATSFESDDSQSQKTRLAPSRSGFQVSSSLKLSEPKASTQAKKQWKDLVTGFFLLKKPATPPRAVALRLSSPLLKKEVITSLLFCTRNFSFGHK